MKLCCKYVNVEITNENRSRQCHFQNFRSRNATARSLMRQSAVSISTKRTQISGTPAMKFKIALADHCKHRVAAQQFCLEAKESLRKFEIVENSSELLYSGKPVGMCD